MSDQKLPWVSIACVCEKVLREPDHVMTLVRIVDTFYVPEQPVEESGLPVQHVVQAYAVITLKAGGLEAGSYTLHFRRRLPSGEVKLFGPEEGLPVVFTGDEPTEGTVVVIKFSMKAKELGIHLLDVVWEGKETLTTIPIKLAEAQDRDTD